MSSKSTSLSSLRVPEKLVYEVLAAWEEAVEDQAPVYFYLTREMLPPRWPWPEGQEFMTLTVLPDVPGDGANGSFSFTGRKYDKAGVGKMRLLQRPLPEMVSTARHELGHMLQGIAHKAGVQGGFKVKRLRRDIGYEYGKDHYAGTDHSLPHEQRHIEYKTNLDSAAHAIIMGVQSHIKYNAPQSEIRSYVAKQVKRKAEKAFGDLRTKKAQRMASELYTLVERGLNQRLRIRLNPKNKASGATHRLSLEAAEGMLNQAALTVSQLREEFLLAITLRDRFRRRLRDSKDAHAEEVKELSAQIEHAEAAAEKWWDTAMQKEAEKNRLKEEITRSSVEAQGLREEIEDLRKHLEAATTAVQSAGFDKRALRRAQETSMRKQAKKQRRRGR